ncbi:MAG TPA: phosphotyrosine protein phosphatase [Lachnospiraceae bacterium]|nr:phosphotyrosine protein phosphatase [Lachnospiraceae bacterium]
MKYFDKIIFVDTDDTARALMAAEIMRRKELLSELQICSRGLVVLFPTPANQKAEAVLANNGIRVKDHESKQLTQGDIDMRTLILTMETGQKEKVRTSFRNVSHLYSIQEFTENMGDIPGLFGAELSVYGKCYELLDILVDKIVDKLNQAEIGKSLIREGSDR